MATFLDYVARFGVPTANNASLNPEPDAAFNIMFTSYDPTQLDTIDSDGDGHPDVLIPGDTPSGDLFLDNTDILDPSTNTYISLDGGVTWQQFTVNFFGYIDPAQPKNYDHTADGGPNFNTVELVAITLADGTELFFFPTESFSLAEMDLFQNAGVPITTTAGPQPICFVHGTMIATLRIERAVEDLEIGELVMTRDNGPQAISWIGKLKMSGNTPAHLLPIRIKANALGNGLPKRDLLVSPQHRILVSDWRAELLFGESEVLVAAKHLVNDDDIRVATDLSGFEYYHILFESHQTVFSEGIPSESFHPGDFAMKTLSEASRTEVLELFPELAADAASYGPATHVSLRAFEAKAMQSA